MLEFIETNRELLSLALQLVMVLIWIGYLQLILIGILRQRRPVILIHRSDGMGDNARCLVSNMGAEAVYLVNLVVELSVGDDVYRTSVIDKYDEVTESGSSPDESAQGPIQPGEMRNVGSFGDILRNAVRRLDRDSDADETNKMRILALCASGHSAKFSAGWREFRIGRKRGQRAFIPIQATTSQIRSGRYRRSLQDMLEDDLAKEADFTFRKDEE